MNRIVLVALLGTVGTTASTGLAEKVSPPKLDAATAGRAPVVVELFTSEGCSSCPPADVVLGRLQREQPVPGVEIIGLGEHVDYWNYLGWPDRFSAPIFSARQAQYHERAFPRGVVYTPQVVVDGIAEALGSNPLAVREAIVKAAQRTKLPMRVRASSAAGSVTVAVGIDGITEHRAAVVLVAVEDGLTTDVQRGENRGRTLAHDRVVRWIDTVARVDAGAGAEDIERSLPIGADWDIGRMRVVALLQDTASRAVLGAAEAPISALVAVGGSPSNAKE